MDEVDPLTVISTHSDEEIDTDELDKKDCTDDKDDWDVDSQDLFITVHSPEKHILTMETYISYKVSTKTTRSCFDNSEYSVQRRYQDFVWLRGKLETDHPTHLIPPLPAKFVMKGMLDRFSSQFTETRCWALNKFLVRLSQHPVVSFNEHLKIFLTAKEFTAHRKQSDGLMSRVSGSVKSMTQSTRVKERDPEFTEMFDNMTVFGEKMAVLDRIAERLLTEKKELARELEDFTPTFSMWASIEDEVLAPAMTSVSTCLEQCANAAAENAKMHETEFIPPHKEYMLYAEGAKQVLKRRDAFQAINDRLSDECQKTKNEKDNLPKSDQSYSIGAIIGKSPNEVKQQKESKLNQHIDELSKKRDESYDALEQANANLRADMERWNKHKVQDIATLLRDMADAQVAYHSECLASWENVLPTMQEPDEVDSDA